METLDLDVATEFLLIAATLVELKARRLLPGLDDLELDEELLRFEERDLLLARLLECKTFKDAAARARGAACAAPTAACPRTAGPEEPFRSMVPDPLERVPARRAAGRRAARARRRRRSSIVDTDHIAPVRASVRDAVESCCACCPSRSRELPRARRRACRTGSRSIVRFLAVLELYKQGVVDLVQFANFGELLVRRLQRRRGRARRRQPRRLGRRRRDRPRMHASSASSRTSPRRGARTARATRDATHEARRAIEAVVLAATEPVEPRLLAQLVELPVAGSRRCATSSRAEYEDAGPRLRARAGRGWLPLPDPSRPRAVRRAVRARGPARAAVGAGARDARDRRLQAADLARADLGDPWRQRRGHAHHARCSAATCRRSAATPGPASRCSTAPRPRSSSASASTRSPTCRRSATSCPTRRSSRRSSAACASSDDPEARRPASDADHAGR